MVPSARSAIGQHERKRTRVPDCETRSVEQGRKSALVIRRCWMERPSLNR